MNDEMIKFIIQIITVCKRETSGLSVDERIKRLMYSFIVAKADPKFVQFGSTNATIYGMMYDIDPTYAKTIYENDSEYTVLHQLGLSNDVIEQEVVAFAKRTKVFDKALKDVVGDTNEN